MKIKLNKLFVAVTLLSISMSVAQEIKDHPDRKDVAGVRAQNKEMILAQKEAKKTLLSFVKSLENKDPEKRYLLKIRLKEGDKVEHVWLEPVRLFENKVQGILSVEPIYIEMYKKGDSITPLPSQISDWIIFSKDGSKKGGYTSDVISKYQAIKE